MFRACAKTSLLAGCHPLRLPPATQLLRCKSRESIAAPFRRPGGGSPNGLKARTTHSDWRSPGRAPGHGPQLAPAQAAQPMGASMAIYYLANRLPTTVRYSGKSPTRRVSTANAAIPPPAACHVQMHPQYACPAALCRPSSFIASFCQTSSISLFFSFKTFAGSLHPPPFDPTALCTAPPVCLPVSSTVLTSRP